MPRIPFAGEQMVQTQALPGVRQSSGVNADAFGAAGGRALEKIAGDIQQMGRTAERVADVIEQEDTRKAREAWAKAQADADVATEEARSLKGVDVSPGGRPPVSQTYGEKLKTIYGKHTQGLSEYSRSKFDAMWAPYSTVRVGQVQRHERDELDAVDVANSEAGIARAQKDMAADPMNPEAVEEAKRRVHAEMAHIGRKKGWDLPTRQERVAAELTRGHMNAVSALAASDRPGDAQRYLDRYSGEIDPRVLPDLQAKVKNHTETALSQNAADQLWAKHQGNLNAALEEARQSHEGTLEEKVLTQLKTRAEEAEYGRRKQQKASFDAALTGVINATTAEEAVTAAMKADVEPELRLRLINVANGLARAERGEGGNPAGLVDVMEKIDREELKTPLEVQAAAGEMKLSKTEIRQAVQYQQQGGISGEIKASKIASLVKGWKKDVTGEELGDIVKFVAEDLKKQAPGKPVTDEELSQRVAGYLWKGETTQRIKKDGTVDAPGWFTPGAGWNESALKARRAGNIESWIPDISSDEETALRAELADLTGIAPGKFDEATLRIFKKQKAGLPLGAQQRTKVPTPSSEITSRQSNKAMQAASLLDNSGAN